MQRIIRLSVDYVFKNPSNSLSSIVHRLAVCSPRTAVLQCSQFIAKNASLSPAHSNVDIPRNITLARWRVVQLIRDGTLLSLLHAFIAVDSWKWFRHLSSLRCKEWLPVRIHEPWFRVWFLHLLNWFRLWSHKPQPSASGRRTGQSVSIEPMVVVLVVDDPLTLIDFAIDWHELF